MSTFVGHGLAAVTVLGAARLAAPQKIPADPLWIGAFFLAGSLPDLDAPFMAAFGPVLTKLPFPRAIAATHRGITHTMLYVAVIGPLFCGLVSRWRRPPHLRLLMGVTALAVATHLALDIATGCGKPIPAFWPITAHGFLADRHYLPCSRFAQTFRGLFSLWFSRWMTSVIMVEIAVFAPLALATLYWNLRSALPAPWSRARVGTLLTVAAGCGSLAAALSQPAWQ